MTEYLVTNFERQSAQKVYDEAGRYTKSKKYRQQIQGIGKYIQLPMSQIKARQIKNLAQYKKDQVKYSISSKKYQNQLFKRLEEVDRQKRELFAKKIEKKKLINKNNLERKKKYFSREVDKSHGQLNQFYKKISEKNNKQIKENYQNFNKLQKQLLHFYQNLQRKNKIYKQINTCYEDAVYRKDKLYKKNEQFSQRSNKQINFKLARNSAKGRNMMNLSKLKSVQNKKKQQVYKINCQITSQRQHSFIQKHCNGLNASARAFQYKGIKSAQTKQRIQKFFQDKMEKMHSQKKRVDDQKSVVSQRCINYMDRSKNAITRQTISSFRESSKSWSQQVRKNKNTIYKKDDRFRNKIMRVQLDMRLRNTCSFLVQEKMDSMIAKAKMLSKDYL